MRACNVRWAWGGGEGEGAGARLQLLRELACRLDPQAVLPHPGVCFC